MRHWSRKMSRLRSVFFATLMLMHKTSGQVLEGAATSKHCTGKTCATLYFLNSEGEEITRAQGSGNLEGRGVKGVAMVQQIGTGCFTIFKGKHQKGTFFDLRGNSEIDLKKEGITMTTIKWIFSKPIWPSFTQYVQVYQLQQALYKEEQRGVVAACGLRAAHPHRRGARHLLRQAT